LLEDAERASDRIGVEKIDTKVGTTKLFGLPEARGVAVASGEDAKPTPEVAKDEAWATSLVGLASGGETLLEMATLMEELELGWLATGWAESTCWTAFAMAARKAGDVGDKTDEVMVDGAVEATLESNGVEIGDGGISSDSGTRDKAS